MDFRLTENRTGSHDLLLARQVGKELREMPYDALNNDVELPAALVGSVVRCRPVQVPDGTGVCCRERCGGGAFLGSVGGQGVWQAEG